MKKNFWVLFYVILISIGICIPGCTSKPQGNVISPPYPSSSAAPFVKPSQTQVTTPSPVPTPQVLTMSFAGDVIFDNWVGSMIDNSGYEQIISGLNGIFNKSDISMINLETPISLRGTKENDKQFTFRAKPEYVKVLTNAGINMVTLANNHILDFGPDAMSDTIEILKKNNISYAGAGENVDEASRPVYINKNGTKVAILSSSHVIPFVSWTATNKDPGVAVTYDPTRLLSEIEKADKNSDIVVVYVHWGEEMKTTPVPYQKNLARMYIDKGADIVIGSHPHVLQGIEYYKDGIICYSLGNFIFTNTKKDTAIVNIEIRDKNISEVKIIPCEIVDFKTRLADGEKRHSEILKHIEELSYGVYIHKDGRVFKKQP